MADDGVIKRLLLQLGFAVDEASQARFDGAMIKSTALGVAAGEAIFAGAKKAVSAVIDLAEGYEKLYFASKRTGSTAAQITDLSLSLRNAGVDAATTMSTLEGLAQFMRTSMASDSIMLGLHVKPEDIHNAKKSLEEIVAGGKRDFGDTDIGYKQFVARMQGLQSAGLNIPEEILNAQWHYAKPDTTAEDMEKRTHTSMDTAATAAHDMNSGMRDLDVIVKSELTPAFRLAADTVAGALNRINGNMTTDDHNLITDIASIPATGGAGLQQTVQDANNVVGGVVTGAGKFASGTAGELFGAPGLGDPVANQKSKAVYDRLLANGLTPVQAAGMTGAFWHETGGTFDPQVVNPNSGARGLEQLLSKDRIAAFEAHEHVALDKSTWQQQTDFAAWEVRFGNERKKADKFLASPDAFTAGYNYENYHERPDSEYANRAAAHAANHVQNVTINVTSQPGANGRDHGKAAADGFNSAVVTRNTQTAGG